MNFQKIKRRIPFIVLVTLTLVAIVVIFISDKTTIAYSLGTNYLVSAIFYFIVVYLPEKRKQKDVSPYIFDKIENLIFSMYAVNSNIINTSGKGYSFKTLKEDELTEACKAINPKEHKSFFHNGITNIFEHHFGYKCYNDWSRIISSIEELFRFLPYMDTGLVYYLNQIRQCPLGITISSLKDFQEFKNENMEVYAKDFYQLYILTKNLRDYYVIEFKKEFRNDPWASQKN